MMLRILLTDSVVLDNLKHILIFNYMVHSNNLRIELCGSTPDVSMLQLFQQSLMDRVTEITHCWSTLDNNRCIIIWNLSLWLCVNSYQVKIIPNLLHKFIEVPFILGWDWNVMGVLINNIKFFNRDLIDLIKDVNAWNINSIAFNNIN